MTTQHEDIKKHSKKYILVYVSLMILTVATVFASYLPSSVGIGILIALIIATVKSSLVAGFFMHLIGEKKMIYWVLLLTAIFFVFLIFLPLLSVIDGIKY